MPEAEAPEIIALKEFLAATESLPDSASKQIAALRNTARDLLAKYAAPVRIAITGEFGAGKSTVVSVLTGKVVARPSILANDLPPVILSYGESRRVTRGFWGETSDIFDTSADTEDAPFDNAFDYIRITDPAAVLMHVDLIDVPGLNDPNKDEATFAKIVARSDAVIWCTNAVNAWRESERRSWSGFPDDVRRNGVLVVTHIDLKAVRASKDRLLKRLNDEAAGSFRAIVPLASPDALASTQDGQITDKTRWQDSGGTVLLAQVHELVDVIKTDVLEQASALVREQIAPLVEDRSSPIYRVDVTRASILDAWKAFATRLVEGGETLDSRTLFSLSHDALEETADLMQRLPQPTPDIEWLKDDFRAAADELTRVSGNDEPDVERVALVLLQLGNELRQVLNSQED